MHQTSELAHADTFPKLLRAHAAIRGARPAIRYKDRGIWQTWSWSQAHDIVRAFAWSLRRRGVKRGDKIAIAGGNRPALYWSMTAAQWLGAAPVPVYVDMIADEIAYVLENADVKAIVAQDQEQVDKVLSIAGRLPTLEYIFYDEARGLADYDDARLVPIAKAIEDGLAALKNPEIARLIDEEARGRRRRRLDHSLYVRNHRLLERRRALGGTLRGRGARHGGFRQAD